MKMCVKNTEKNDKLNKNIIILFLRTLSAYQMTKSDNNEMENYKKIILEK
jgi:hypothetical protein